jgi:hypothetical protein
MIGQFARCWKGGVRVGKKWEKNMAGGMKDGEDVMALGRTGMRNDY